MDFVLQWADIIWLPLAWLVARKDQRLLALACLLANMMMLRMMAELMDSIHHAHGFLGLIRTPVLYRGIAVYSFFDMIYLLLIHFSPRTKGAVFLAASITIFFASLFTFAFVMVL